MCRLPARNDNLEMLPKYGFAEPEWKITIAQKGGFALKLPFLRHNAFPRVLTVATLSLFVRILRRTCSLAVVDPSGLLEEGLEEPYIFVLWHNRLLMCGECVPREFLERIWVIVSASRDGEYASAFLRKSGFNIVRGSSSRGGTRAFRDLRSILNEGGSVAITLDGPRGPRYNAHLGAAGLAGMCGVPVVPVSINAPDRWELKSWDRTQIPKPFSTLTITLGPPLNISREKLKNDRDGARKQIEEHLLSVTDDSRGRTGIFG